MNKELLLRVLDRLCVRYPADADLLWLKEEHVSERYHGRGALIEKFWASGTDWKMSFEDFCDQFSTTIMCCVSWKEFKDFEHTDVIWSGDKLPVCPHCKTSLYAPEYDERHYPIYFIEDSTNEGTTAEDATEQQPDLTEGGTS